jgi:hypothetical protein
MLISMVHKLGIDDEALERAFREHLSLPGAGVAVGPSSGSQPTPGTDLAAAVKPAEPQPPRVN